MWNLGWYREHQSKNQTIQELEKDKIKKAGREKKSTEEVKVISSYCVLYENVTPKQIEKSRFLYYQ